jgi:hypothetical protein
MEPFVFRVNLAANSKLRYFSTNPSVLSFRNRKITRSLVARRTFEPVTSRRFTLSTKARGAGRKISLSLFLQLSYRHCYVREKHQEILLFHTAVRIQVSRVLQLMAVDALQQSGKLRVNK